MYFLQDVNNGGFAFMSETKWTKAYRKEYNKKYREQNKEKIKEYEEKRNDRKEERKEYNERTKEQRKEYKEKNKEKIKKQRKEYSKKNRDAINIDKQKRRTLKRELPATLTKEQWKNIKNDFNNSCAYCGEKKKLAQEHFIALSKKGEYTHNNIIPACMICNSSKCNNSFFEWYPKYKYYSKKREKFILKYLNYKKDVQQLSLFLT